ncbi:MAG TPA: methionine synthase [Jatrophihabitans sp.]|nr:methionine synthase [Jatrophihabitans sp.]
MSRWPWQPGAVTGIGSLPGTDPAEAATLVFGELPDLPHLAELPNRGPGAEMIGRTAGMLVDLPVEVAPSGWRFAAHAGRDLRRARDHLSRDLDALQARAEGYRGPLKVQAAGPWTLAANLELATGHKVVSDHGAVRDLVASLAEGLRAHLADVAARVPGAEPVLQLDEPSLPAVLGGRVATPSGYGTVAAVEASVTQQALTAVLAVAPEGGRVVHCCAAEVPLRLLHAAGVDAVSLDRSLLTSADYDALGELVDAGVCLWLGVVEPGVRFAAARDSVTALWRELGFAPAELARRVVPTPVCGLPSATDEQVRATFAVLRDVGRSLLEQQ